MRITHLPADCSKINRGLRDSSIEVKNHCFDSHVKSNLQSRQNRLFTRSFILKQGFQLRLCRFSVIVFLVISIEILKNKQITEIAPILCNNSFRLGLPTFVVNPRCIKVTIKTAMKFRSAKCAYFPPADRKLDFYCLQTEMASFHLSHRNDFLFEPKVYLLDSSTGRFQPVTFRLRTTFLKSESH